MQTRDPALRLIIAYKLVRAGVALLAGLTFLVLVAIRLDASLHAFALELDPAGAGFPAMLQWATEHRHIVAMGALLTVDGVVTFFEGFALWRGWWWGAWLVVGASGLLVPFEVAAIAEHVTVWRLGVLGTNLAIVGWLLRARLLRPPELRVDRALKSGGAAS